MLFKEFEKFLPLLAIGLIQAVPFFGFAGVAMIVGASGSFATGADMLRQDPLTGALSFGLTAGMVMWFIGYFAFILVWGWAMTFAIPLIIEHGVGIGDTIKLSFGAAFNNAGGLFVLGLWGLLVGLLGILALFVGIFVAIPVIQVAGILAYRQVFPRVTFPPDMPQPSGSIYD